MKVRELLTTWIFDIDNRSLDRMDKKIGDLRNNAKSFGANMKSVTDGMVSQGLRLTAFVTLPIVAIGAAMIKAASDAEETESKFAVVFKDITAESETVASELAKNFGLASDTSKRLLSDTGDLLTGFGFTGKSALDLSKGVQELAVDLASFTNFAGGAEGASAALTKALLGERESVKALGISILEEDVKAKIAALEASGKLTNESERQKKAIATLAIAMEQSKNAIGDFARTSGQFANQQRILGERIRTVAISFGKILIPFALKAVKAITALTEKFDGLSKNTKEWILISFGVVAVMAPMLLFAGLLGAAILSLGSAFTILKVAIIAVRAATIKTLLTWAIIPLIVGVAISIVALLLDGLWGLATGSKSALGEMTGSWGIWGAFITERIKNLGMWIKFFWLLSKVASAGVTKAFNSMGDSIVSVFDSARESIKEFSDWYDTQAKKISKIGDKIGGFLKGAFGDFFGTNEIVSGVTPAQAIAQAATLPAATVPAGNGTSSMNINNIDIKSNMTIQVPPDTPAEQQRALAETAQKAAEDTFNREVRKMTNENPEAT